ncbi:hypothetical protein [Chitinophaga filiformis]|nr:hypothetical protein [Chitinophaga filiformis]
MRIQSLPAANFSGSYPFNEKKSTECPANRYDDKSTNWDEQTTSN